MSFTRELTLLAVMVLLSWIADCFVFMPAFIGRRQMATSRLSQDTRLQATSSSRGALTKDDRFRIIFTALQEYKAGYGDMYVPVDFIVPDKHENFSAECWGLPLGTRVQAIRTGKIYRRYRSALDKIGFPWNAEHTRKKGAFERFILALGVYNECKLGAINDIPYSFRIPETKPWPADMHGYWLGRKVAEVRRGLIFTSPRYQQVLSVVGLEVPNTIISPSGQKEQEQGDSGESKRSEGVTFGYIGEVSGVGEFGEASYEVPRRRDRRRFDLVYRALLRFRDVHGHLDVPSKYVVSAEEQAHWPEDRYGDLHGLRLGQVVSNIRQGNSYSDLFFAAQLDRMGFVWSARDFRQKRPKQG